MKYANVLFAILVVFAVGCGTIRDVTLSTKIKADGSVERHIKVEAREEATLGSDLKFPDPKGWQVYRKEEQVFEARGTFKSVADIPLDFEKAKNEQIKETSKSQKTYSSFKCALLSTYEYTETITDISTFEQYNKATDQFLALKAILYELAEEAYGKEYDLSAAKAWIEKEIVPRARMLLAVNWEASLNKSADRNKRGEVYGKKLLAELGIKQREGEDDLDDEDFSKFFYAKMAELIKPKKGGKLTPEQVKERVEKMVEEDGDRVEKIAKQIVTKRFGSEEAFEAHVAEIDARLFGAYTEFFNFFPDRILFEASVTMPGRIVETNGVIDGNEVSWLFTGLDVFPSYKMSVRSVAFTPANGAGDKAIIKSTRHAVVLAEFVQGLEEKHRARILTAISEWAKTRDPAPLRRLAVGAAAVPDLGDVLKKIGLAQEE